MKSVIRVFWIFIIGSILGCVVEEIWCLLKNKVFQIRKSLIYLPMIPIYGIAAVFITIIADIVGYNLWKVFFIGALVATLIEYFSSWIQEKIFHTKSWDYSQFPFNLHGRVNLLYSIGFGLFAVLFIKQLNRLVFFIRNHVPMQFFFALSFLAFVFFTVDVVITIMATYRQKQRREGKEAKNQLEKFLDKKYPDERLNKIYNNSVYVG